MRGDDLAGAAKLRVPLRVRRITMLPDFTKMLTDAGLPNMVAAVILFIIGLAVPAATLVQDLVVGIYFFAVKKRLDLQYGGG